MDEQKSTPNPADEGLSPTQKTEKKILELKNELGEKKIQLLSAPKSLQGYIRSSIRSTQAEIARLEGTLKD